MGKDNGIRHDVLSNFIYICFMEAQILKSRFIILLCLFTCMQKGWSTQDPVKKAVPATNTVKVGLCGISPAPEGSTFSHEMPLKELLDMDSLCVQNGMVQPFKIKGYHLILMPVKGYMEDIQVGNNKMNETVKHHISKLPPGSIVVFDNINAVQADGTEIKLSPMSILLK